MKKLILLIGLSVLINGCDGNKLKGDDAERVERLLGMVALDGRLEFAKTLCVPKYSNDDGGFDKLTAENITDCEEYSDVMQVMYPFVKSRAEGKKFIEATALTEKTYKRIADWEDERRAEYQDKFIISSTREDLINEAEKYREELKVKCFWDKDSTCLEVAVLDALYGEVLDYKLRKEEFIYNYEKFTQDSRVGLAFLKIEIAELLEANEIIEPVEQWSEAKSLCDNNFSDGISHTVATGKVMGKPLTEDEVKKLEASNVCECKYKEIAKSLSDLDYEKANEDMKNIEKWFDTVDVFRGKNISKWERNAFSRTLNFGETSMVTNGMAHANCVLDRS